MFKQEQKQIKTRKAITAEKTTLDAQVEGDNVMMIELPDSDEFLCTSDDIDMAVHSSLVL